MVDVDTIGLPNLYFSTPVLSLKQEHAKVIGLLLIDYLKELGLQVKHPPVGIHRSRVKIHKCCYNGIFMLPGVFNDPIK